MSLGEGAAYAAAGAGIPLVFKGVGGLYKLGKRLVKGRRDNDILETLKTIADKTGLDETEITSRLKNAGKEDTLADLFPETVPESARIVREAGDNNIITAMGENLDRSGGARQRIREALPADTGYHKTMNDMVDARKLEAEQLYGDINTTMVNPTPKLVSTIKGDKQIRSAYGQVVSDLRADGVKLPPLSELGSGNPISGRILQRLKWEVDNHIRALRRSTDPKDGLALTRLLESKKTLMEAMDETAPGFAKANEAFAGRRLMEESMEQGKKDGVNKVNVEDQLDRIASYGKSEKETYGKGVMSNILDKVEGSREDSLAFLNRLNTPKTKRVMDELFGEEESNKLIKAINRERDFKAVEDTVMGGKAQQVKRLMESELKPESLDITSSSGPIKIVLDAVLKIANKAVNKKMPASEIKELGALLTDPSRVQDAGKLLLKYFEPEKVSKIIGLFNAAGLSATNVIDKS